jgi:hypothetical protein
MSSKNNENISNIEERDILINTSNYIFEVKYSKIKLGSGIFYYI